MALTKYDVFIGDTGVVHNAKPKTSTGGTYDVSTGGWSCRITLSAKAGSTEIVGRDVTDVTGDNTAFIAYLKPAETAALAVGTYLQTIQVTNSTIIPIFNLEKHVTISIKQQGAA